MKIKIKSREEIEKTLEEGVGFCREIEVGQYKGYTITMRKEMLEFCGRDSEVETMFDDGNVLAFDWYWHPDWYEVLEDFTEEDLMDIELMDEMLEYFLEARK